MFAPGKRFPEKLVFRPRRAGGLSLWQRLRDRVVRAQFQGMPVASVGKG